MAKIEWIVDDFKDMTFNVRKVQRNQDIFKVFPCFNDFPIFKTETYGLNRNNVLKYICYAYDKGSPLYNKFDDVLAIRNEAAFLAGFNLEERVVDKTENGKTVKEKKMVFPVKVENMILGQYKTINHMIVRFLFSFFHPNEYATFRVLKDQHFKLMNDLHNAVGWKDSEGISKALANISKQIDDIKDTAFRKDELKSLRDALYEQAEMDNLDISPEHKAERLILGYPIVENPPYGQTYELEYFEKEENS